VALRGLEFDEFSHEVHGEDERRADAARGLWVICDGVSNPRAAPDGTPAATSQKAAKKVATALIHTLGEILQAETFGVTALLRCIDLRFSSLHKILEACDGDTTALALLHQVTANGCFWCYGYLGTGLLVVTNPSRRISGIAHAEVLLSPQEFGDTIAISSRMLQFSSSVGAVLARAGDIVLIGSDGMVAPWNALVSKGYAPAEVLLEEVEKRGLANALSRFAARSGAVLRDDATAYLIRASQ
jgi:hypothetical protein